MRRLGHWALHTAEQMTDLQFWVTVALFIAMFWLLVTWGLVELARV
jgi:hypothetical protein